MRTAPLACLLALAASGCSFFQRIGFAPSEADPTEVHADARPDEPARVYVQHVLVSFEGTPVPTATRTKEEAKRLADRVLAEAKAGRSFDDLVRLYSDDRENDGKLGLVNWGCTPEGDEAERRKMVRGYCATAFSLKVGEIAQAPFDPAANPLGWFVIRRLK